jgi:hypothetical protein
MLKLYYPWWGFPLGNPGAMQFMVMGPARPGAVTQLQVGVIRDWLPETVLGFRGTGNAVCLPGLWCEIRAGLAEMERVWIPNDPRLVGSLWYVGTIETYPSFPAGMRITFFSYNQCWLRIGAS